MGEVYRAVDTRLQRSVAVKILPLPALAADPELRDRSAREARVISSLNHPNICTLFDVGEAPADQRVVHFLALAIVLKRLTATAEAVDGSTGSTVESRPHQPNSATAPAPEASMLIALRRHSVPLIFALTFAVIQSTLTAQTRPAASATPIGQFAIGDGPVVPIYLFSFGASNPFIDDTGSGGATGKVTLSDIGVMKQPDALSASLLKHVAQGTHLPRVRIEIFSKGSVTVATAFDLADVVVTSYQVSGADAMESVAMHFDRLLMTTAGNGVCWDVARNMAC
jgi:hypothetical protein